MMIAVQIVVPLIGLLAFLCFLATLFSEREVRDWQRKAKKLLGLSGVLFCGSLLYGVAYGAERRPSVLIHELRLARAFLVGILLGIFVTLWLEGSLNPLKKDVGEGGQPEPPPQ